MTPHELFGELQKAIEARRDEAAAQTRESIGGVGADDRRAQQNAAARDFSIALTHLEDAWTRFNSGRYHQQGIWKRTDPDANEV